MTTVLAAALTTMVSGAAIEKRDALPAKFTLTSTSTGLDGLIYPTLMYANSSAYIGNIKYSTYSESLDLTSGGDGASFQSFHSSPTGSQRLYVYPTESKPIGFTVPHSAAVPTGAVTTGITQEGGLFAVNGISGSWKACKVDESKVQGTWQLYWDGAGTLEAEGCVAVNITVAESSC
ncbi:hypothetical protein P167DRAFT_537990 [Morchella conica CCBAS932]|uniref:Cell wall protein PhiA n=2 Tax=Morchella sect. Distantes TaxID=1051054 RepID=A0A3N4KL02_9PEZI|nr:hypothetical protein P167DRAFT_537990 [Morchella conica CCBAS932]